MRIRKNIKSVFQRKPSSSFLICQLNRSPWEDDSFFTQGDCENDLPLNGSLSNSNPTSDSEDSKMEVSFENVEKTPSQSEQEKEVEIKGGPIVFPGMLAPGNYLSAPLPPKKEDVGPTSAPILPRKRGRPKKPNGASSRNGRYNNSDDILYYAGFGPSWGKRRGVTKLNHAPQMDNSYENGNGNGNSNSSDMGITRHNGNSNGNGNCHGNGSDMEITRPSGSGNGKEITRRQTTSWVSNISEDDIIMLDDDDEKKDDNKSENNEEFIEIKSYESILEAQRELDYIEDEDEDEDEELYGGRWARKPIKARSLKSLM